MSVRSHPPTVVEYRIVCSHPDHRMHAYPKPSFQKAQEAVEKNTADAETMPLLAECLPWRVEKRVVGAWRDAASDELDLA